MERIKGGEGREIERGKERGRERERKKGERDIKQTVSIDCMLTRLFSHVISCEYFYLVGILLSAFTK